MSPTFDFRCGSDHITERSVDRSVLSIRCRCGRVARRELAVARLNGLVGIPMKERPIHLNRFVEAHDEMVYQAERAGVTPPDTFKIAKARAAAIQKHRPDLVTGGR